MSDTRALIVSHGGAALCEYEIVPNDNDAVRAAVDALKQRRTDQTKVDCYIIAALATPTAREPVNVTDAVVEKFCEVWWSSWYNPNLRNDRDRARVRAAITAALGQHGGEADGPTETGKVEDAAAMLCGALMAERLGGSCDKSAREYENELVALLVGNAASPPNAESVGEKP